MNRFSTAGDASVDAFMGCSIFYPMNVRQSKTQNSRTPQETAQAGLRILARIIAREAIRDQLAKMEIPQPVPLRIDISPVRIGECIKEGAGDERF